MRAQAIGSSTGPILLKEILPNITGPLMVVASVELAHAILLKAALSSSASACSRRCSTSGLMIAEAKTSSFSDLADRDPRRHARRADLRDQPPWRRRARRDRGGGAA